LRYRADQQPHLADIPSLPGLRELAASASGPPPEARKQEPELHEQRVSPVAWPVQQRRGAVFDLARCEQHELVPEPKQPEFAKPRCVLQQPHRRVPELLILRDKQRGKKSAAERV